MIQVVCLPDVDWELNFHFYDFFFNSNVWNLDDSDLFFFVAVSMSVSTRQLTSC